MKRYMCCSSVALAALALILASPPANAASPHAAKIALATQATAPALANDVGSPIAMIAAPNNKANVAALPALTAMADPLNGKNTLNLAKKATTKNVVAIQTENPDARENPMNTNAMNVNYGNPNGAYHDPAGASPGTINEASNFA